MNTDQQRRLLRQVCRSQRERVVPDLSMRQLGTPGLRREELAARAGTGVAWCASIDQGRDVGFSSEALDRLALALAVPNVPISSNWRDAAIMPRHDPSASCVGRI